MRFLLALAGKYTPSVRVGATTGEAGKPVLTGTFLLVLGLVLLPSAGAAVLVWKVIWTEDLLHQPASRATLALLSLLVALMMAGVGALRWMRARTSRRPRWQRVHAVLVWLVAAYSLFLATSLM